MKVVLFCGGLGLRLGEHPDGLPKPMVPIGYRPILWHIMRYYAHYGCREFVVALGYRGESIRAYFAERGCRLVAADGDAWQRWDTGGWAVELVDTGLDTQSGGRLKRLAPYLGDGTFMLTWCDGLADVDLDALLAFHKSHGHLATLTAVRPPPRFGRLALDGHRITAFREKAVDDHEWINGAFFVLEPGALDYAAGDQCSWEHDALTGLAEDGQLMAFRHTAFWQCMDTLHEAQTLNALWHRGRAPWKVWE